MRAEVFEALNNAVDNGYRATITAENVPNIVWELQCCTDAFEDASFEELEPHVWAWLEQGGLAR
jgi:hypothetical protein